jgi:hypothetical protein
MIHGILFSLYGIAAIAAIKFEPYCTPMTAMIHGVSIPNTNA